MLGLLERAARADAGKIAIVYGEQRIGYGELLRSVQRCACGMQAIGIGEGDCVAAVLPNCPEFIITFFASAAVGAIFLPLNPQYKKDELLGFREDARPKMVVSSGPRVSTLREIMGTPIAAVGEAVKGAIPFAALLSKGGSAARVEAGAGRALYLYTSGSTGAHKRVCCTQENLYWEARNFVETAGLSAADTILCTIPLFHSYGIGNCLLDAAYLGATLVILEPELDASDAGLPFVNRCHRVAELFRTEDVRFYPGVPYQFSVLASLPQDFPIDLRGVRLCASSGDALPRNTYDRFLARFGHPIRSLYGSTEAGSIAINMDPGERMESGSLGLPLGNVTIEIRDVSGFTLPVCQDGEIWVKSPAIPPSGYDNRSDLTRAVFRDGFYNTGDIGHTDPLGRLVLAGRTQSFLNIGGYKVDTTEVEEVLLSYPGVREAAVLGVEVPRMGTLVKAVVVAEGPCRKAEIQAFCRQRLAFYKVPRLVETRDALPRSAVGKLMKSELGGVEAYLDDIRGADTVRILSQLGFASHGRRRSLMASLVQAQAAAVLARTVDSVPRGTGFIELGMDSFSSIELHTRLEYLFDRELPQTLTFDHPTVDAVADNLIELLPAAQLEAASIEWKGRDL